VKPVAFRYHAPASVKEAVALLQDAGFEGKVLAGGQSLVPMMNFRLARPQVLVDIRKLHGLSRVRHEGDHIVVGALTTHEEIFLNQELGETLPVMKAAAALIGHWGIRARGTIGGSVAHADPAAEWPAVMMALEATAVVSGPDGEREVPVEDLIVGPLTTSLEPADVLTALKIPVPRAGERSGIYEVARRPGDFALVGAVAVTRGDAVRITWFGLGAVPQSRSDDAFGRLASEARAKTLTDWGQALDAESDIHASATWRKRVAAVVARRALEAAAAADAGLEAGERSGLHV
jgi:carbon-monoxide dehydrogenase medium subunit